MLSYAREQAWQLMERGGVVMWPLLGVSLLGMTLVLQRCWFWATTNHRKRLAKVEQLSRLLRQRKFHEVRALVGNDSSVYGEVVRRLLQETCGVGQSNGQAGDHSNNPSQNHTGSNSRATSADNSGGSGGTSGGGCSEAAITEIIESQRPAIERFMSTLSTIITVAPMLGILGTVTGIISSFRILSQQTGIVDPREVGQGIAEALLTTAAGLLIAIFVLLPYNAFRAQVDRTLARIETLAASASSGKA